MNSKLLKLEGLMVFILSSSYYFLNGFSWIVFVVFLLAPDIGMLGYARNPKIGAYLYNGLHTYGFPLLLIIISILMKQEAVLLVGLIWTAHIGMDRALGYGLKFTTGFKDTHLGKL